MSGFGIDLRGTQSISAEKQEFATTKKRLVKANWLFGLNPTHTRWELVEQHRRVHQQDRMLQALQLGGGSKRPF